MSAVTDVDAAGLADAIARGEGVLLALFSADWCRVCDVAASRYAQLAARREGVQVLRVDVARHRDVAERYEIESLPGLVVLREGIFLLQREGLIGEAELEALVDSILALDMDRARAELEQGPDDAPSEGGNW